MDDNGGKVSPPEPGGVQLDPTGWEYLRRYVTAKKAAASWEAARIEARDKLVEIMGHYEHGHFGGRRVMSVVRVRPKSFNVHAFSADHPGLWDQYREEGAEQARVNLPKDVDIPEPGWPE